MTVTPILLLGAGRMGGAILDGWRKAGAFPPTDILVRDPQPGEAARASGAVLNPPDAELAKARTVLLAVKPQIWRESAAQYASLLAPDAVIVSVAAGVTSAAISEGFGGRRVARVMPTTAVGIAQGTASLYADDPEALERARVLFGPLGLTVDLETEDQMHAATAVSGSAPAYLYAFIEALEAAGVAQGLTVEQASRLARATITGSAALLAQGSEDPGELRRQVTSPGGTTAAALKVLMDEETGFPVLLRQALEACAARSRELGK